MSITERLAEKNEYESDSELRELYKNLDTGLTRNWKLKIILLLTLFTFILTVILVIVF